MEKIVEFFKALGSSMSVLFQEPPKSDLDAFIKFKNPQSKEELDLVMGQYDEMRRIESRLISRGEYSAAAMIKNLYWN